MKCMFKITVFAIACLLMSCNSHERQLAKIRGEIVAEEAAQQARLEQYADSTVYLSFKGIELGQPFLKTIQKVRSHQDISNMQLNKDKTSATCQARIYLPNRSNALDVDVKIASFQDTITSFLIMSTDYDTREDLKLLYTSRYDELFSSKEKDEGYWGDKAQRSNSHSLLWTFKNQSLRFTTFSTEKRENYVKNPKMRSPENRYGVKYTSYFEAITIIYSDLHHCKKVEEYEAELKAAADRIEALERKEKQKADSINRVKINQRAENQDF